MFGQCLLKCEDAAATSHRRTVFQILLGRSALQVLLETVATLERAGRFAFEGWDLRVIHFGG